MYRQTKQARKFAAMRKAKEVKRLAAPVREYPRELPDLRKVIITIDYDFEQPRINTMRLYKCGRINQYRAEANGRLWRDQIGLSGVLAGIRKSMPPVMSLY